MTPPHRVIAAIATIVLANPLFAQASDGIARSAGPGDVVRLHENSTILAQGMLMRRDSTGLVVLDRQTGDTVHIPVFQITRAEVQRGSRRRGWSAVGTGAAIGAVIGGVFVGLALITQDHHEPGGAIAAGGLLAIGATTLGTAVGTIAALTSTEIWVIFDPAAVPWERGGPP